MMDQNKSALRWKTSLQCTLSHRDKLPEFTALLQVLREEGFHGIELNLPELDIISPDELVPLLQQYGLALEMLATGAYARAHHLSLSDCDFGRRSEAVAACRENIAYAARAGCGVILGFFKGGAGQGPEARARLVDSLRQLSGFAAEQGVLVLLESTNSRESSVACTLGDTLAILDEVDCPCMKLLADTYHIHLEEPPVTRTLRNHLHRVPRLHISDDNRAFPGLGSLDFSAIYDCLKQSDFDGSVAIEGNVQVSLLEDTHRSAAYLREACRTLGKAESVCKRQ